MLVKIGRVGGAGKTVLYREITSDGRTFYELFSPSTDPRSCQFKSVREALDAERHFRVWPVYFCQVR